MEFVDKNITNKNKCIMNKWMRMLQIIMASCSRIVVLLTVLLLGHSSFVQAAAAREEVRFVLYPEDTTKKRHVPQKRKNLDVEEHTSDYHYGFGGIRSGDMEDAQFAAFSPRYALFGLFDGHTVEREERGMAAKGFMAAKYCAEHFHEYVADGLNAGQNPGQALGNAFKNIDRDYLAQTANYDGTTAAVVLIDKLRREAYFGHLGDTRAVLCSDNGMFFETKDHGLDVKNWDNKAEVAAVTAENRRIAQAGGVQAEAFDAAGKPKVGVGISWSKDELARRIREGYSPNPISYSISVTRSIGDRRFKASEGHGDILTSDPTISGPISLAGAVFLIIACDGVWDIIDSEQACQRVMRLYNRQPRGTQQAAAKDLVDYAFDNQSRDNVSATVVYLDKLLGAPGQVGADVPFGEGPQAPQGGRVQVGGAMGKAPAAPPGAVPDRATLRAMARASGNGDVADMFLEKLFKEGQLGEVPMGGGLGGKGKAPAVATEGPGIEVLRELAEQIGLGDLSDKDLNAMFETGAFNEQLGISGAPGQGGAEVPQTGGAAGGATGGKGKEPARPAVGVLERPVPGYVTPAEMAQACLDVIGQEPRGPGKEAVVGGRGQAGQVVGGRGGQAAGQVAGGRAAVQAGGRGAASRPSGRGAAQPIVGGQVAGGRGQSGRGSGAAPEVSGRGVAGQAGGRGGHGGRGSIPELVIGDRITLEQGDIAKLHGEPTLRGAVVSTANAHNGLTWTYDFGAGIAGAISRAAGPGLKGDVNINGKYINPGEAIITNAYGNLLENGYAYIIHVAGPDCGAYPNENKNREVLLNNAYTNVFKLASENDIQRVVLPFISTGIFGCPLEESIMIGVRCAQQALIDKPTIQQIIFLGPATTRATFQAILNAAVVAPAL